MSPIDLEKNPVHLGPGGKAVVQPRFTGGMDWYMAYGDRHDIDGVEGRLVSMPPTALPILFELGQNVPANPLRDSVRDGKTE